jgi:hypothetical protein
MNYSAMPRRCRFFGSPRREAGAYLRGSVTDEQRWRGEKAARPGGRERFGSVARSLQIAADILVAPASPSNPKRSCATWLRTSTGS